MRHLMFGLFIIATVTTTAAAQDKAAVGHGEKIFAAQNAVDVGDGDFHLLMFRTPDFFENFFHLDSIAVRFRALRKYQM